MDYDPNRWHADLRRRVIESFPTLYPYDNERILALLEPRPQDQIYTHIAIVEALQDIPQIPQEDVYRIRLALREHEYTEHVGVIEFLSGLLDQIQAGNTAETLAVMNDARDQDRIFRTCIMRVLPRLFDTEAVNALWLMMYFYRRVEGEYAEHCNVRRPAAIALPKMISLLGSATEAATLAKTMVWQLSQNSESIMRRAVIDELPGLASADVDLAQQIVDQFILDTDPYVRRRAWGAKAYLAGSRGA
jgi:hypothetical protein